MYTIVFVSVCFLPKNVRYTYIRDVNRIVNIAFSKLVVFSSSHPKKRERIILNANYNTTI